VPLLNLAAITGEDHFDASLGLKYSIFSNISDSALQFDRFEIRIKLANPTAPAYLLVVINRPNMATFDLNKDKLVSKICWLIRFVGFIAA